jgi:GTP-binding protein
VRLELRLLADVGLVGYPNVGKSTLISRMSEARPRIADYPFTTLVPNLGVVTDFGEPFVMADVPGLIEGAHAGLGLGHGFLRHLKRTRLLVHLVDMSPLSGRDPATDYRIIRHELAAFSPRFHTRPEIVVASKMDVTGADQRLEAFRKLVDGRIYPISAVTGEGLSELGWAIRTWLDRLPPEPVEEVPAVVRPRVTGYRVVREDRGWRVEGDVEERAVMTRFGHYQDEAYLIEYLRRRGVQDALQRQGPKPGDLVRVGPGELVWTEGGLVPRMSREAEMAARDPASDA